MAFMKVALVDEVPAGTARQFEVQGRNIALFNVNGSFYAIDGICPHRGAPLAEGECLETEVMCPWHGARFDLTTGSHLSPPARSGVTAYRVQLVGNEVQVDLA